MPRGPAGGKLVKYLRKRAVAYLQQPWFFFSGVVPLYALPSFGRFPAIFLNASPPVILRRRVSVILSAAKDLLSPAAVGKDPSSAPPPQDDRGR